MINVMNVMITSYIVLYVHTYTNTKDISILYLYIDSIYASRKNIIKFVV